MLINDELKRSVWEKGTIITEVNANWRRKDIATACMSWNEFGKETLYGWTIAYIDPYKKEGKDNLDNLLPLHWENSKAKGNSVEGWMANVSSVGMHNIYVKRYIKGVHF